MVIIIAFEIRLFFIFVFYISIGPKFDGCQFKSWPLRLGEPRVRLYGGKKGRPARPLHPPHPGPHPGPLPVV